MAEQNLYDVIVVGGGPAGLSAAIYMARARYRVLVIEKEKIGGQITITSEIVNYPGVERTSGTELTHSMQEQAEAFGAEFIMGEVVDMELDQDIKVLHTTKGDFRALGVVLAIGANPRKLGFKGEKEFQGRGVAYCATCDGEFFTNMDVFVIGGGFAAVEEGIFLTRYARKVVMIVREDDFTCAKAVSDEISHHDKISVKFNTEIVEVHGKHMVSYARFRNNKSGEEWSYEAEPNEGFGVFVFAGYVPNTAWLGTCAPAPDSADGQSDGSALPGSSASHRGIALDEHGYIVTDRNQKTNLDGVYAAGDVCIKNLRQVVTAVSDGAVAATSLERCVSALHDKLKIPQLVRKAADTSRLKKAETPDTETAKEETNGFFTPEIRKQLEGIFPRFEKKVIVKAWLDDSPLSGEIGNFLGELEGMSDKVTCVRASEREKREGRLLPSMELCREDGSSSGISFHGVPGGHEFNSFIIALYNVAGPGQQTDPALIERLKEIRTDKNIKIMVSLSCTMCPEVVMAAQKAAAVSEYVEAEMIDLMHYPELKEQYQIMSVPCMVVNDNDVYFGKKNLEEVVGILSEN